MARINRRARPQDNSATGALAEVRRIYADLATQPVERQCIRRTECCQFKLTGLTPYLTKGEAFVAARAWRATGRKKLPPEINGACPMLEDSFQATLLQRDGFFHC